MRFSIICLIFMSQGPKGIKSANDTLLFEPQTITDTYAIHFIVCIPQLLLLSNCKTIILLPATLSLLGSCLLKKFTSSSKSLRILL